MEFPLDKSLLGRLAPADFWAQERGHAEGVASGVRFVRAAALQLSRVPAEGKPQFMTNPSGGSLPAWLASCQIGADRHRRMTAVGALDAFQTLLWEP